MAAQDDQEVKEVERIEITPAEGDDDVVKPEDTDQNSSSDDEGDDDDESKKPDELVHNTPPAKTADKTADDQTDDGLEDVDGETPRERALRAEVTRLKGIQRKDRADEIFAGTNPPPAKRGEISDEDKAVLGKYKPEEIASLKEVLPVLAKEMGYVRQDDLAGTTFADKAQDQLDTFLEKHPEYLPENDKDGTLWGAFKNEYLIYKQPANPKDFSRIFDKIHRDVFGIKPTGALTKVNAQQEKAKVASHAGASSKPAVSREKSTKASPQGYRTDMLKGFSDDEKAEMFGEE